MNQSKYNSFACDNYNDGPLVDLIESRIAGLLKKSEALFFNKGTTCQLAALKTICESRNNALIAIHPQSHIAIDEEDAYQHVTALNALKVGSFNKPITMKDLDGIRHNPAVLVIEMPLRRAGFKLAGWQELLGIKQWCLAHEVHLHMDGARLWESAPYYQKSVAEISAIFDSVYISLYKGIGGISGALLGGDVEFVEDCNIWRARLGSQMWSNFPALITGLEGIDNNLPHIQSWVKRATEIADSISTINNLQVTYPQTNGFLVKTHDNENNINKRMKLLIKRSGISPCKAWTALDKNSVVTEVQVGALHTLITNNELNNFFNELVNS